MTDVDFGLMLFTHRFPGQSDTAVLRLAVEAADLADELGFDSLWTTEHHFIDYGVNPSALGLAAFLLGRTRRLRVGTAISILPTHSPVHVAEQAALLDQVSGGRFDLGVGRGGPVVDYEALGTGLEHWRGGLPEAVELLLAAFTGPVEADSALYRFRSVTPAPHPLTRPHPPVYLAAFHEAAADRAAGYGLPMLFFFQQDANTQAMLSARHAEAAATAAARSGSPPRWFRHGAALIAHVADSDADAEHVVRTATAPMFARADAQYVRLEPYTPMGTTDEMAEMMAEMFVRTQPIGTVERCVERLVEFVRVSGTTRLMLHAESTGDPEQTLQNVRRLGTDVIPEVRRLLAEPRP